MPDYEYRGPKARVTGGRGRPTLLLDLVKILHVVWLGIVHTLKVINKPQIY